MSTEGVSTKSSANSGVAHNGVATRVNGTIPQQFSDEVPEPVRESVEQLRREVVELARSLPGELRQLAVRSGECEIKVEWAAGTESGEPAVGDRPAPARITGVRGLPGDAGPPANGLDVSGATAVRAPLVGTYYAAPSPDAEPFVRIGDEVEPGTKVAIIEAMKMMNPIVAESAGVVVEILVTDNDPVEYDQVLMLLRPKEHP
jgi:acetyl-CoA carboxylase biotin carboxyl carrier protein